MTQVLAALGLDPGEYRFRPPDVIPAAAIALQ
jgi:hypothetical protein